MAERPEQREARERNAYKFNWVRAVAQDGRITLSQRGVLMFVAVNNCGPGEIEFAVRQRTVAKNLKASERTVRDALANARKCGWLMRLYTAPGGRGWHESDKYGLTFPEETAEGIAGDTAKHRKEMSKHRKKMSETAEKIAGENRPLPADSPDMGLLPGSTTRVETTTGASRDDAERVSDDPDSWLEPNYERCGDCNLNPVVRNGLCERCLNQREQVVAQARYRKRPRSVGGMT